MDTHHAPMVRRDLWWGFIIVLGCVAFRSDSCLAREGASVRKSLPTAAEIAKLPKDGGKEFNRLIFEKSPYLRQHARNPVDWYPWGAAAFARAKKEDKPIFLSVGYSTCHWCHVMEHESFERDDVAKIMNEFFVCIKVDREERPDVDEIYMSATQAFFQMTGQNRGGGWPNSVWLTGEKKPWYAGTYFPREHFKKILTHTRNLWEKEREAVERNGKILADHLQQLGSAKKANGEKIILNQPLIAAAVAELTRAFDRANGGFGGKPKFPPHQSLALLLMHYENSKDKTTLEIITRTLDKMAAGGIRDHVGGGFHRYATDAKWFLPHFEKMLYDNAQLSRVYVHAWRLTKKPLYREVASEINDWVLRVMTDKAGGFYSALDADSDGEEGKFYLWKPAEIKTILGAKDGALFCRAYEITAAGTYYDEATGHRPGTSIAHLPKDLTALATAEKIPLETLAKQLRASREKLRRVRAKRVWPHLDDKVLVSWNGLMIGALAYGGKYLQQPKYTQAAARAANFILTKMRPDGRLRRTYRGGDAKLMAYLDDYVFLADGLLDLYDATADVRWLNDAKSLMATVSLFYRDAKNGGFFLTAKDHEALLVRTKNGFDKAIPSGNGVAANVFARLAAATSSASYAQRARDAIHPFQEYLQRAPQATMSLLQAVDRLLRLPPAVANPPAATPETVATATTTADATHYKKPVKVEGFLAHTNVAPGTEVAFAVRLIIDNGYHVNVDKPKDKFLIPTALTLKSGAVTLGEISYPHGSEYTVKGTKTALQVYAGTTIIRGSLRIQKDAKAGALPLTLAVKVQPCSDSACLAIERLPLTLTLNVTTAEAAAQETPRHTMIFTKAEKITAPNAK